MGISLQPNPDETPWIDAWIRWERDPVGNDDNDDDEDGNEDYQPESPTQTFACRYDGNTKHPTIDISLKGFPSDSQETWNSTGLTLWRSSEHLCEYLLKELSSSRGLFNEHDRFLELGSGLGRCGILAFHCLSSIQTTTTTTNNKNNNNDMESSTIKSEPRSKFLCLTDGDTDVLRQLRENIQRNQPHGNMYKDDNDDDHHHHHDAVSAHDDMTPVAVTCSQLRWGYESTKAFLSSVDDRPFDVIFGSDLIYVAKNITPLFETVTTVLSPPKENSCFIMAHCTRREGNEVSVNMVLEAAESFGLQHDIVDEDDDITVFVFRWKRG